MAPDTLAIGINVHGIAGLVGAFVCVCVSVHGNWFKPHNFIDILGWWSVWWGVREVIEVLDSH